MSNILRGSCAVNFDSKQLKNPIHKKYNFHVKTWQIFSLSVSIIQFLVVIGQREGEDYVRSTK